MGFLKPNIESREVKSQATPLSEDVLGLLRRQIMGGGFGSGLGPLQREAGTAVQQFVGARRNMDTFRQLAEPLRKMFSQETEEGAAGLRESFGAAGLRFGSPLAQAEGDFRADRGTSIDATLANLFANEQAQLLNAISLMQGMGTQNIMPILQLAGMGINPEQTIVTDNPIMSLMQGAAGLATGAGDLLKGIKA